MYLIDSFELVWLKAFLGERHDIKLEVEPHVFDYEAYRHPAVKRVTMDVVFHIDIWSSPVKNHAAPNPFCVRVSNF